MKRLLFVEPPKEFWFVMGEYLPPPFSLLQLAGYVENAKLDAEIDVLDCQVEGLDWTGLEKRIETFDPDMVAASSLGTCNAYTTVRALEAAKKVKPSVLTVTGGQHFTALAQESLATYPSIDFIARSEGEETLTQLIHALTRGERDLTNVQGLSYRANGRIVHNAARPLIEDLDSLPLPAYHFVEDKLGKYHFTMMADRDTRYMIVEGSRGCLYDCNFCGQWPFWRGKWRAKSPRKIAEEMEQLYSRYGTDFFWLTDDNFNLARGKELSREIVRRGIGERIMWFTQARCDDVASNPEAISEMRRAGCYWILLGVESGDQAQLNEFHKGEEAKDAAEAFRVLKRNDIFAQGTFIIGNRKDTRESIARLRGFVNSLDPDLAIFMILTPFPGTALYEEARSKGWIEDPNWSDYDMIHAVMPTESLSTGMVQEELYECYRSFYGSGPRRLKGLFSKNKLKRRTYRYLAGQNVLNQLKQVA
jgi:anaerobic magnesium-protoporphyrin IX monomethyl ester cyclase